MTHAERRSAPRSVGRVILAGLLGVAFALAGPGSAQAQECEDISGDWLVDLTFPGNPPQTVTVTLEQSECGVSGMVKGNNETAISDGSVEGSTFTFTTTVDGGGQMVDIVWEGTVEGDTVSGTLSAQPIGVVEFAGKRAE